MAIKIAVFLMISSFWGTFVFANDNSPYDFAYEYISTLGAMERIREANEGEFKQTDNPLSHLTTSIHYSTQIILELQARVAKLKQMHLSPRLTETARTVVGMLEDRIEIHELLRELSTKIMSALTTRGDVGTLLANLPRLRAMIEVIDETIFSKLTPLAFLSLLDEKPDHKGMLSFLVLTKQERQRLLSSLDKQFGKKLTAPNQNYIVGSAAVFRGGLLARKCSDER